MSFPLLFKKDSGYFLVYLALPYVLEFRIPFVWKNLVYKDKTQSQESFIWFFRFCCLNVLLSVVTTE